MDKAQVLFVALALVAAALIVVKAAEDENIQTILDNIPEDERIEFLRHNIQKGYDLANVDNKGNINLIAEHKYDLPDHLSIELYEMARKNHRFLNDYLLSFLGTVICFPSGECRDIGDVGVHPKKEILL